MGLEEYHPLRFNGEELRNAMNEEESEKYREILKLNGVKQDTEKVEEVHDFLIDTLKKYNIPYSE